MRAQKCGFGHRVWADMGNGPKGLRICVVDTTGMHSSFPSRLDVDPKRPPAEATKGCRNTLRDLLSIHVD